MVAEQRAIAADQQGLGTVEKQGSSHHSGNHQRGVLHQRVTERRRCYQQYSKGNLENARPGRAVPGLVIAGNGIFGFEMLCHVIIRAFVLRVRKPVGDCASCPSVAAPNTRPLMW